MAETLLTLRDVAVHHGEHVALQRASLEVYTGDVLALIGPNGAGKSTLLRVMGMLQRPDHGDCSVSRSKRAERQLTRAQASRRYGVSGAVAAERNGLSKRRPRIKTARY